MALKTISGRRAKRIRGTHLWIHAMVEVLCYDCVRTYQDDNGRQPEDLKMFLDEVATDATAIGWRMIDGSARCPNCARTIIEGTDDE